jgi:hypothetical protein
MSSNRGKEGGWLLPGHKDLVKTETLLSDSLSSVSKLTYLDPPVFHKEPPHFEHPQRRPKRKTFAGALNREGSQIHELFGPFFKARKGHPRGAGAVDEGAREVRCPGGVRTGGEMPSHHPGRQMPESRLPIVPSHYGLKGLHFGTKLIGVRHGVSKGVENGRRLPARRA